MHLSLILDMAADAMGDRVAVSGGGRSLTYADIRDLANRMAGSLAAQDRLVFLGVNSAVLPVLVFAAGIAGVPFVPLNYRLTDAEVRRLMERASPGVAVVDRNAYGRAGDVAGIRCISSEEIFEPCSNGSGGPREMDPDQVAVLLFTSGTTGEPKAALLRHRHIASYVMSTLDFGSADEDEAALVSVPPYHIAGLAAIVSSAYLGRRIAYLESFTPEGWVEAVVAERITHAMVVPTMLTRVLDLLERKGERLEALRHLSYGGGRMPVEVIERALRLLPHVGFVNAYGLTETSSTVSVLGPEDHRVAMASSDPLVRARLGSVGRPHSEIEVSIRDPLGDPVPEGGHGEIWLRGSQVAGEYASGSRITPEGWFPTNDGGYLDDAGFLFVEGRLDDVIVRGGENISPGEVEDALRAHPEVSDVAVLGEPSTEWGEQVVAIVVRVPGAAVTPVELAVHVATRLRTSRVPARFVFREALPYSDTGKLLRRLLRNGLS